MISIRMCPRALGAIAVCAMVSTSATAKLVVDNLSEATSASAPTSYRSGAFQTGSEAGGYTLESIIFKTSGSPTTEHGNFVLQVRADNGGEPGDLLADGVLSGNDDPFEAGNYTYTASGVTLDPSTLYWLSATVSTGSAYYYWDMTNSTNETVYEAGWSISELTAFGGPGNWSVFDNSRPQFGVSIATASTPSPGPIALLSLGGLILLLTRPKKRVR
jgi:hypothetical protein